MAIEDIPIELNDEIVGHITIHDEQLVKVLEKGSTFYFSANNTKIEKGVSTILCFGLTPVRATRR